MSIGRVPGVTGIQPSIVDAKGDLIVATAADSVDRLAVGANNTVLTADSATATGLKWAAPAAAGFSDWTTWTPTWTNVTVGNGTVRARYTQSNKVVLATILLQFGSTTSITANNPRITLPVTAVDPGTLSGSDYPISISSYAGDWNTQGWKIDLFQTSTTAAYFQVLTTSDTYGKYNAVTSTIPITFGTNDILMATFMYEAA